MYKVECFMLIKIEKNIFVEELFVYMLFIVYGFEYFGYNDW